MDWLKLATAITGQGKDPGTEDFHRWLTETPLAPGEELTPEEEVGFLNHLDVEDHDLDG